MAQEIPNGWLLAQVVQLADDGVQGFPAQQDSRLENEMESIVEPGQCLGEFPVIQVYGSSAEVEVPGGKVTVGQGNWPVLDVAQPLLEGEEVFAELEHGTGVEFAEGVGRLEGLQLAEDAEGWQETGGGSCESGLSGEFDECLQVQVCKTG